MNGEKDLLINDNNTIPSSPPKYSDTEGLSKPYGGANPPSYSYQGILPTQQGYVGSSSVHVVTQPTYTHYQPPVLAAPSDNFLILSILLSVLCCLFGSWLALCCTIPAIFAAVNAREAEMRGDREAMRTNRQTALCLNIVGFVFGLLITIGTIVYLVQYYNTVQNEYPSNN